MWNRPVKTGRPRGEQGTGARRPRGEQGPACVGLGMHEDPGEGGHVVPTELQWDQRGQAHGGRV